MTVGKLHFSDILLPNGWHRNIVIDVDRDGNIKQLEAAPAGSAPTVKGFAIPGVPNVHSHAHQRAMAGLAESGGSSADTFWTWRTVMYEYLARLRPEDLQRIAAQLYVEMLKGGFTSVGEFQYLHNQPNGTAYDQPAELSLRCLRAAQEAGIGITLMPVLYRFSAFGQKAALDSQCRFVTNTEDFIAIMRSIAESTGAARHAAFGMAPHSLRAVSTPMVLDAVDELDRLNAKAPIHIHIAEQEAEVEACEAWAGKPPVAWLLDNYNVSNRWCAIHATHTTDEELRDLAASGCVAGLCPTTEANLGDGVFAANDFLANGGAIAIGSDSHITVDAADEIRILEYSQRLRDLSRNVLADGPGKSTGLSILNRVLEGGRRALGQPIGRIAVGARADIVVLDADHPLIAERFVDEVVDSWIFAGGRDCVRHVFVGGDQVITDGRHAREEEILDAYRVAMRHLLAD